MVIRSYLVRLFAVLGVLLLASGDAFALQYARLATDRPVVGLTAIGPIVPGDFDRLNAFLETLARPDLVFSFYVDSPGGNIVEAEKIAAFINKNGAAITVPSGSQCASACFLLFAAVAHRFMAPDALIGVHSASENGQEDLTSMSITTALARDAAAYGVPPAIIGKMVQTEPGRMAWLTPTDLQSMDVVVLSPSSPQAQQSASTQQQALAPGANNSRLDTLNKATAALDSGDYATALQLVIPLANQGDALAEGLLGALYNDGDGVPQDYAQAAKWFRRAADQGDAASQADLGLLYHDGRGVPQDYREAMKWCRRAADQNYAEAEYTVGMMYDNGQGVTKDYAEAIKWFRRAGDQGYVDAQFNVGNMYQHGEGVPKDDALAAKWFGRAAEKGDAVAQDKVGVMYMNGQGVPKDDTMAAKWFRRTSDQGDAMAQGMLGNMYLSGRGVPQDYILAYVWFNLSAAAGAPKASEVRARIARLMTPAQIAEAQRLSREWKPRWLTSRPMTRCAFVRSSRRPSRWTTR
jgi:TPR repeat protein